MSPLSGSLVPDSLPQPRLVPPLDPGFLSAALWNRAYAAQCARTPGSRPFALALERPDGTVSVQQTHVLAASPATDALNFRFAERLLKFLLWQRGGARVLVGGAPEIAAALLE